MSKKKRARKIKRPPQYKKPRTRTLKEWFDDQSQKTKRLMRYAATGVLSAALLIAVFFLFVYDDGSLPVRGGAIVGAQDNWIITDLGKRRAKYYHLADIDTPEGYRLLEDSILSPPDTDSLATTFTFEPEDADAGISLVYIQGVAQSPDDMINAVYGTFQTQSSTDGSISEAFSAPAVHGIERYFLYDQSYTNEETGEVTYSQALVCYLPTPRRDTGLLVNVYISGDTAECYLPLEDLRAVAEAFFSALTFAEADK